ncbi:hypothetical protein CDAR_51261 [Caerostris darwini]|uniref:Uncharacterized protein n=1 Tax=Caerostris darwini TaxID=1538125 RepID=A0AAV4U6E4_9ARAC|nr:hypothetical protein CDAR_51261 [Caerostris darwini]
MATSDPRKDKGRTLLYPVAEKSGTKTETKWSRLHSRVTSGVPGLPVSSHSQSPLFASEPLNVRFVLLAGSSASCGDGRMFALVGGGGRMEFLSFEGGGRVCGGGDNFEAFGAVLFVI